MTMPKIFESTVFEQRGERPRKKGDLGIEIEAEGRPGASNPGQRWEHNRISLNKNPQFWAIKEDHSLRNGLEYVSKGPVPVDKLEDALAEWVLYTDGTDFRTNSIRTSVHYHVNVSDLTINQVLAAIVGYWLVETPLVDTQGPTRVGNLFCLRVSDADFLVNDLISSLETDPVPLLGAALNDNVKYAALNLNTVRRFGSLEFRFNKGTTDPKEIIQWGRFLYDMVHKFAAMNRPAGVIRYIEEHGSIALFEHVAPRWLIQEVTKKPGWLYAIESNYSYAYMVHSKLEEIYRRKETERNIIRQRRYLFGFDPDAHVDHGYEYKMPECQEFAPDEEQQPATEFHKPLRKKRGYVIDEMIATQHQLLAAAGHHAAQNHPLNTGINWGPLDLPQANVPDLEDLHDIDD